MPLIDWGTVSSIRPGDTGGPASGMSTSATTNANDLSVYGLNQFGANGNEPPDWSSRKQGIHGNIHGDYDPDSDGYNGDDGGDLIGPTMGMEGTAAGSPVAWWFALGGTLIALKLIAEKNGDASEFKTIRVGASNILIITLSSIVGLTLLKWVFGIYKIPGLSQIVEAV